MAKAPRYEGVTPESTPAEAARAILGPLLAAALREAPAVLREQDARATHDMRVALRRLARRVGDVRDADAATRTYAALLRALEAGDARRTGLAACRANAVARSEEAVAGVRKFWAEEGAAWRG